MKRLRYVACERVLRLVALIALIGVGMGPGLVNASGGTSRASSDAAMGDVDPCGGNDVYSVSQNTTLYVASPRVLANDGPGRRTVTGVSGRVNHGTLAMYASGGFTYTPDPGFVGIDTATYTVTCLYIEGGARTGSAVLTINVTGLIPTAAPATSTVVSSPTLEPTATPRSVLRGCAVDDAFTTPMNATVTVTSPGVIYNDSSPWQVNGFTMPAHGHVYVQADGQFTYIPEAGFVGMDTFTYTVQCGKIGSFKMGEAIVTITVTGPPPTATTTTTATSTVTSSPTTTTTTTPVSTVTPGTTTPSTTTPMSTTTPAETSTEPSSSTPVVAQD